MTDDQILQIAARHSAYADCTPTLRGDAILAFARELLNGNRMSDLDAAIEKQIAELRWWDQYWWVQTTDE